jgi:hypothetical protein
MKSARIVLTIVSFMTSFQVFSQSLPLSASNVEAVNAKVEDAQYKGKKAVRVTDTGDGETLALVKGTNFKNGTIEVELAGTVLPGADSASRGFIGISFRTQIKDTIFYECFYLRPTNGRASVQLRRNHSVQYISHPYYPWFKLRKENPGEYESYSDLVTGAWTKVRIEVKDKQAKLYVNGAEQPCLIVNDMKRGISSGAIALWIGSGTDGYFRDLKVKASD